MSVLSRKGRYGVLAALAIIAVAFLCAGDARATTYEVGPGKTYTNINDVPLEDIAAGDTVLIYYRAAPYKEKWVVTAPGTQANPVKFEGVPGGGGELPVLDGDGATTRQQLSFWSENRAVVKLGESSVPPDVTPSWITFENLDFKSARPPYTFTDDTGAQQTYGDAASGIWIVKGRNITVRNCIFRDCGNGFMTYSTDSEASGDILVEGCYIYDNGISASLYQHNNYTASQGITFQYNHFGPLRTGCLGGNLKDRSSGMVIRYNWIESGNRELDLVDAEDSSIIRGDPEYGRDFVYGNILIEHAGDGNRQIVHYGGDSGADRNGDLYFYNNTIISTRTDRNTLFLNGYNSSGDTIDMRNNIVYGTLSGSLFEISSSDSNGTVNMTHNWLKPGYTLGGGTVNDDGTSVTGSDPGFVDEGGQDYHITETSACRDEGTSLHAEALPDHNLYEQYVKHQSHEARPNDATFDIGAFEYSSGGPPPDLVITTSSLPAGVINVAYSATVECTGGLWPYTWSIISGSLPPGLSLNSSSGVIDGTPTDFGTYNFTVQVVDSQDPADSDTQALSITVNLQGLQVSGPPAMRDAYQSVNYSQLLSADQGLPPYTWSIISGSLPAGLSLNSSTGEISGSATATGASSFTVQVTDSQGTPDTDQKDYSINVVTAPPASIYYVATTGNDGWDGSWGSPWATLQYAVDNISAGDIILVRPGTYAGCRIESSGTASLPKTLASETIGAATLNAPGPNQVYNGSIELENTGGTVSYWAVDGFAIDGGGTLRCVDARDTDHVTIKNNEVFDSVSTGIYTEHSDYVAVENNHAYSNGGSGVYNDASSDNGVVRDNLFHDNASNGVGMNGDQWATGDGIMTGWLFERNTIYNNGNGFSCDGVEDSTYRNNLVYYNTSKSLYLYGMDGNTTSRNNRVLNNTMVNKDPSYYTVMIYNDYPGSLPHGVGNKLFNNILYNYDPRINRGSICIDIAAETDFESNYNVVMEMFGLDDNAQYITFAEWQGRGHDLNSIQAADTALFEDPANYDYHLKTGSPAIDAGTTLADVNDDIEGNARPYNGVYDIGAYEKTAGAPANLVITTTSLPDGQVGIYYSETMAATGGQTPYTWAIISGALPAGLALNSSTGEISGTPTGTETANFTAEVTDSQGTPDSDTQALSITITGVAPVNITTSSLPNGQVAVAYSQTLAATGGVTPYTWAVTIGALPAGLSLNASTGEISGTPTTQETANFTVEVTDSQVIPDTDTQALSITIDPAADLQITTTSLPDATQSVPYSQTLAATGGMTPYSWAVISGALPAGLSLNGSTGQISGTPTTLETANFTVEVTDSQGTPDTDTQALSITVTTAAQNTYYVSTTGNDGWDGSSGTPWATIQHAVDTVTAGDTIIVRPGTYVGARIETTGVAGLPITLKAETPGTVLLNSTSSAEKHNGVLEIENWDIGTVAYWIIEGLEVDGVSNTYRCIDLRNTDHCEIRNNVVHDAYMTGIFCAFSDYVLVENNTSYDNGEHGIYVNNSADNGTVRGNTSYNNTYNGIHMNGDVSMGGDGIMSNWLVELNTCYDNPATGINCDGVEDSTMRNNLLYHNNSKGFSIYGIDGAVSSRNDRILNNTVVMPTDGSGYYAITVTDDAGPPTGNKIFNNILYHYSTASNRGSICMATSGETGFESNYNVVMEYFGLDDNAQILTFAQWQARGYDLDSIQATDTALFVNPTGDDFHLKSDSPAKDAGTTLVDVTEDIEGNSRPQGSAYDIGCYEYVEGVQPLNITTTSLPDGDAGVFYSQTLAATGGVQPYSWAVISGALPSGLSLNSSTGEISGTPDTGETANFTVEVTDSDGPPSTDQQALSITINVANLVITTSSLPDGVVGTPYSQTLQATGGLTPYSWAVVSGSLPAGLSLNSSTGEISGTPTTEEVANFTVEVTDSQGTPDTDQQALSITIVGVPDPLEITTTSLPDGEVGVAYSQTLQATGGVTPYSWAVVSGSLPAGLSLNSSTGEISGTPTAYGTSNFTVEVTDSQGVPDSDQKALSIYVAPANLVITTASLPGGTVGVAYSETLQATGGVTPYTWAVITGSLPAGLSLNASTGEISGTPTTAETANFTVEVTDSQGTPDTDTQALSITISDMGAV
ncbi:MAG: putative Ig domain-containing protein, partial [Planctomycetota bacterium]